MKSEINGSIIELTVNELDKCATFWDNPNKLKEPIISGEKKAFAYKLGEKYLGGCALSILEKDCGHFSYFSVAPDFRGNGIGSSIIDFAEKYFADLGLTKMQLYVDKNNFGAIRLYKRKDFIYNSDVTTERIAMIKAISF